MPMMVSVLILVFVSPENDCLIRISLVLPSLDCGCPIGWGQAVLSGSRVDVPEGMAVPAGMGMPAGMNGWLRLFFLPFILLLFTHRNSVHMNLDFVHAEQVI